MTKSETNNPLLKSLAQRLETDPRFMAYALAQYRLQEGIEVEEIAQSLGMMPEMMARLAVCLRPDASSPQFAEQVREIADYTLADEGRMANLLRQVSSLEKLGRLPQSPAAADAEESALLMPGLLVVARDRDDEEEAQTAPDEPAPPEDD
jgi:hypothetical protein